MKLSFCFKLYIYSISTPRGRNWAYFRSTGNGFQDMGRFSKLAYLGMKFAHVPNFQKLHMYSLSTPDGQNWPYFVCSKSHGKGETVGFQNCQIWGHETWPLAKFPEFAHIILSFYPRGSKLSILSLYGLHLTYANWIDYSTIPAIITKINRLNRLKSLYHPVTSACTPNNHTFLITTALWREIPI